MKKSHLSGEASLLIGMPQGKLSRLIKQGLIPEFTRAGRFYVIAGDKIDAVRKRLIKEGYIKTSVPAA